LLEEDNSGFGGIVARNALFTSKDRSPISEMLSHILGLITSSDVLPFLKQAEIYGGLRNTQIFDLVWVLENLFNIHGGVWFSYWLEDIPILITG
jgi:hypothetical protein